MSSRPQPFSEKQLLRFFLALIVVLAILAGLYQAAYKNERKRYLLLEDKYVRVRSQLGREKMQELIDLSYQEK